MLRYRIGEGRKLLFITVTFPYEHVNFYNLKKGKERKMTEPSSLFPNIRVFSFPLSPKLTPLLAPLALLVRTKGCHGWGYRHSGGMGGKGMREGEPSSERPRNLCGKAEEEQLPALPLGHPTPAPTPAPRKGMD